MSTRPSVRRARELLRLPPDERRLFVRALGVVSALRVGMWVLPYRVLHRWVFARSERALRRARSENAAHTAVSTARIVWLVQAASARVPQATCLIRALSAQYLLARHGHPSDVSIGVMGGGEASFAAHAWLTCDGAELGAAEGENYTPITSFAVR